LATMLVAEREVDGKIPPLITGFPRLIRWRFIETEIQLTGSWPTLR
jgi:hypothetical protein